MLLLNILYVLLAIAMIALILMQRGAGAQAGSGFGGGASGTVFGARGSANFLSKSTKWLAIAFFGLSLFMAWQATRDNRPAADTGGLMSELPVAPAPAGGAVPAAPATGGTVPAAPVQSAPAPVQPAAPSAAPAPAATSPETAPTGG